MRVGARVNIEGENEHNMGKRQQKRGLLGDQMLKESEEYAKTCPNQCNATNLWARACTS